MLPKTIILKFCLLALMKNVGQFWSIIALELTKDMDAERVE